MQLQNFRPCSLKLQYLKSKNDKEMMYLLAFFLAASILYKPFPQQSSEIQYRYAWQPSVLELSFFQS